MARKTDKQRAQELVDEAARFYSEPTTRQAKERWPEVALLNMKEAVELDPENAAAWLWLGLANGELGNYDDMIASCIKGIEINLQNANVWKDQEFTKHELNGLRGAIECLDKAPKSYAKDARLWLCLGAAKNGLDDHQGAVINYDEAIELDKKNIIAWILQGQAKSASGDHYGAIEACTTAIEIDDKYATTRNTRGFSKNHLSDHQGAIIDYDKAIQLANGKYPIAWVNRGLANFRLGKYDDAIKDFDEALGLDSTNVHTQQYRQGAEIAKLREESGQDAIEHRKESRKRLDDVFKSLGWTLIWYRVAIVSLFVSLFIAIFIYIICVVDLSCLWDESCSVIKATDNNGSDLARAIITTLSNFSFLSIIVFVFLWFIRLVNAAAIRSEILRWDIFSRLNTEDKIDYYQKELGDNRNDIIIAYMEGWINKNLADKLLALHSKKTSSSEKSENELPQQGLKNLLEQIIKSNTKGD